MEGGDFILYCVYLSYQKCHKINFKRCESYLDSPDQIKATKNPINKKDNKYFEYSITVTLNHEEILKEKQKLNFL